MGHPPLKAGIEEAKIQFLDFPISKCEIRTIDSLSVTSLLFTDDYSNLFRLLKQGKPEDSSKY